MAPEMLLARKYDARVDLWSVGVIMYECLFGKAPYSSSSFQELAEKIRSKAPVEVNTYHLFTFLAKIIVSCSVLFFVHSLNFFYIDSKMCCCHTTVSGPVNKTTST